MLNSKYLYIYMNAYMYNSNESNGDLKVLSKELFVNDVKLKNLIEFFSSSTVYQSVNFYCYWRTQ